MACDGQSNQVGHLTLISARRSFVNYRHIGAGIHACASGEATGAGGPAWLGAKLMYSIATGKGPPSMLPDQCPEEFICM
jgi:hypothetical protein